MVQNHSNITDNCSIVIHRYFYLKALINGKRRAFRFQFHLRAMELKKKYLYHIQTTVTGELVNQDPKAIFRGL